ncbi:MAG: outer membrane protein transport protein [Flavobacteriaceae bacterium]|nr:outer membrane protein transport protein [Flavobacteriaceae bacterium]
MKLLYTFLVSVTFFSALKAQEIQDGLRFSMDEITGTARFRAMSGAFGAVGGDLSAINVNPAGSAIFNASQGAITLSNLDVDNDAVFFGTATNDSENSFDLNQLGTVFVFNETGGASDWTRLALAFNYETTANFDNQIFIAGTNTNNSIDNYFLSFADGVPLDLLSLREGESIDDLYQFLGETEGFGAQQAFLGFQSFVIDPLNPDNPDNSLYVSNVGSGPVFQEYSFISSGYNGKFTANFAAAYKDILYLGLNLNFHSIDYSQTTFLFEEATNPDSFINQIGFENHLRSDGDGFSFQLGAIAKLNEYVRVGASYESPTWYDIRDRLVQSVRTLRTEGESQILEDISPNIVNFFPEYSLRTPGKLTGSLALLFGQHGLLSFDYSYKDYSDMEFSPENDPFFRQQNQAIDQLLTDASAYRIGGEYRMGGLSLRGGYRYEDSPYKDGETLGELDAFSLGLGYNFGMFNIDAAFEQAERDAKRPLFTTGLTDTANMNITNTNVVLTLGMKF